MCIYVIGVISTMEIHPRTSVVLQFIYRAKQFCQLVNTFIEQRLRALVKIHVSSNYTTTSSGLDSARYALLGLKLPPRALRRKTFEMFGNGPFTNMWRVFQLVHGLWLVGTLYT